MILTSQLTDTLTIYLDESSGTGRYGDPVPGEDDGTEVPCFVTPLEATEDEVNRDTRINRYNVIVESDAILDGAARIVWKGKVCEVLGEPLLHSDHLGIHHQELTMREVEG